MLLPNVTYGDKGSKLLLEIREESMGYKEEVKNELKRDELKGIWEEICEAYEEGGVFQLKSKLDSQTHQIKKEYKQLIKALEEKL